MIWEQNSWIYYSCGVGELLWCHGVWEVAGYEGDVDVVDVGHFADVFGVSGDVYSNVVDVEYVAVVSAFRMEL